MNKADTFINVPGVLYLQKGYDKIPIGKLTAVVVTIVPSSERMEVQAHGWDADGSPVVDTVSPLSGVTAERYGYNVQTGRYARDQYERHH
jgi:hypothetical protein